MSLAVLADHMASKGRNGDTMLVHMSPQEVAGLHALALAHGGKLTVNPETGLVEAFSLKSLLPMIAGIALGPLTAGTSLAFLGATPFATALTVGGVTGLATGSLKQGIMAGLGAYGGANLASGLVGAGEYTAVADAGRAAMEEAAKKGLEGEAYGAFVRDKALGAMDTFKNQSFLDQATKGIGALADSGSRAALQGTPYALSALARPAMMAAAPVMADAMVPTTTAMPKLNQAPRPYPQFDFDPYGGRFIERPPIYAKSGGIVALADGGTPPNPFAQQIAEGQKAIPYAQGTAATAKDISDIYYSVLGRAPDEGGLQFYQASQFSPDQIRADIMKSPEAQAFMAGPKTHAQLGAQAVPYAQGVAATENEIGNIYREMLGRSPDVGGLQFYQASQFSPEQIRAEIAKSQEYLTRPFTPEPQTMQEVRSDYEAGGGGTQMRSVNTPEPGAQVMTQNKVVDTLQGYLAANPNATIEQIQAWGTANGIPAAQLAAAINERRFSQMTGGSLQAYDYLMGRGAYPTRPFTQTGELMRPYAEAVLGAPENKKAKRLIFDPKTGKYIDNPEYVPRQTAVQSYAAGPIRDAGGNPVSASAVTETYFRANPDVRAVWQSGSTGMSADEYALFHWNTHGRAEGRSGWTGTSGGNTGGGDTQVSGGKAGGLMDIASAAAARGGNVQQYNLGSYSDGGRLLRGPGDGVSDSIPATIGNKQPARLADGEFVVPARIVSEIGNGSTEAGARKLYAMMDRVQRARAKTTGKGRVAKDTGAEKYLPA